MRMTVGLIIIGGLIVFGAVLLISVILPWTTITDKPADIFRPRTQMEEAGRKLYIANGCTYCHTQFIRNIDWDHGAERIARRRGLRGRRAASARFGAYRARSVAGGRRTGRMTGISPISRIPVSPGPNRSCPPLNSWGRRRLRPLSPINSRWASRWPTSG